MKKFLAFSAAVALVATLQANMIEWSLPALTDGSDNALTINSVDDIVFIPVSGSTSYDSVSGVISGTASGSNALIDQDDEYIAGVWTDTTSPAATDFYMAYKGADGTFYALNDGSGDPVQVATSGSNDPLMPGSGVTGSVFLADTKDSVQTVAPSVAVPEPATAVLALAGVAMLIRRRKA